MSDTCFDEDELDLLKELSNIAMGRAGRDLAKVLDEYIELSIPELRFVSSDMVMATIAEMMGGLEQSMSVVRVGFHDSLGGEAIFLFGDETWHTVAELLADDEPENEASERKLLLDISNILAAACLNGLAENLKGSVVLSSAPTISQRTPASLVLDTLFSASRSQWTKTLLVKISFTMESRDFKCDLLLFFSEQSLEGLQKRLRDILNE